jgi:hypothetical protein
MRYHRGGQHECYGFALRLQSPEVTRMVPSPPGPPRPPRGRAGGVGWVPAPTQRGLTDWHTQTAPALEKPQSDLPVSQFRRGEVMCRDYVLSNGRLWPRR